MFYFGFLIGLGIGGFVGFMIAAILSMSKEADMKSYISKIIIILLCCSMLACASPMKKACTELTKIQTQLSKAIVIARVAQSEVPETVKEEHIQELIKMREIITNLTASACILGEILPEK